MSLPNLGNCSPSFPALLTTGVQFIEFSQSAMDWAWSSFGYFMSCAIFQTFVISRREPGLHIDRLVNAFNCIFITLRTSWLWDQYDCNYDNAPCSNSTVCWSVRCCNITIDTFWFTPGYWRAFNGTFLTLSATEKVNQVDQRVWFTSLVSHGE